MDRHQGDGSTSAAHRRASSALRVTLQLALVAALALLFAPSGCALSDTNGSGGAPGQICKQGDNAACDDKNVCHANICNTDGVCETRNATKDPPDDKPGDCKRIHCTDGVGALVDDDTDVDNDGNDCTKDTCNSGKSVHTPVKPGTKCNYQGHDGACDAKTDCEIPCKGGDDCTTTDACTIGACNLSNNKCSFMKLDGVPPPGVPQPAGDCLDKTCVMGVTKEFGNADDLPTVPQCYKPECVDSGDPDRPLKPSQTPTPARSGCSMGGSLCDGDGNCVDCINAGDCAPDGNLCHTPTCTGAGKCTYPNTPAGPSQTLNGLQTNGDCHQIECDGNGGQTNAVDQNDPNSLGNPCINYFCDAGGNNQTSNKNNGMNCGNGLSCSNGVCNGCTMTNQCPNHPLEACDAPTCDCPGNGLSLKTCGSQGLTCGTINDTGCGQSLGCNNGKDGQETDTDCGGPAGACPTRCVQGQACAINSDCANGRCIDGFCCESLCNANGCVACSLALNGVGNGLCRSIKNNNAAKSGCNPSPPCGNDGLCDGMGTCQKYGSSTTCGTTCAMATQSNNNCNGAGACVLGSTTPCTPYQCGGMTCATSCVNDMGCISGDFCSSGTCGSTKGPGGSCATGAECTSTFCVDGVCCGTASCAACKTCNGTMPGTCTTVPAGDDPGACDATHTSGSCGTAPCRCDSGGNCVSGCGVDADCGICQTCNSGTCTNVGSGTTTNGRCDASHGTCGGMCSGCGNQCACDNADHCLLAPGQACTCDANCASGDCPNSSNCSDGASHNCN